MASCRAPCVIGLVTSPRHLMCAPIGRRIGAFSRLGRRSLRLRAESEGMKQQPPVVTPVQDEVRADSVLPENLQDAIQQAAESASKYLVAGGKRAIVELEVSELEVQDIDGSQQQLWDCSRLFLDSLQDYFKDKQFKAIFPDAGAAALLKYQWSDATFRFGSLNDRRPVSDEDEIIVLVSPDYQMLSEVGKIASSLVGDDYQQERPLVMWNPRLYSGDVGVGLNIRRIRNEFLRTFTTVYALKSFAEGAIFKRYPGLWTIFLNDKETPGRYIFASEQIRKPNEDDIERILLAGSSKDGTYEEGGRGSFMMNAVGVLSSFSRFMRSLSQ